MTDQKDLFAALRRFAASVTEKMSQLTAGEAEDQLRGPFENFMRDAAGVFGGDVVCTGETRLPDRLGKPDYAVRRNKLLTGYVELKAPGTGANPRRFTGRNREQWKRFRAIPNLIYTDGNEWGLYRTGKAVREGVRLSGDVAADGAKAVAPEDVRKIEGLLADFLSWRPIIPTDRKGKIDLRGFAALLAPLCGMLRDDVTDALKETDSPLVQLARDWRHLLFPDASDERFADAYAQTATFALLLGRSEGAEPLTLDTAERALSAQHNLLSKALHVLTHERAQAELYASLDLLIRVIAEVSPTSLSGPEDPWLYFYEDFLAVYDPKLRKDIGAYYTPVEVVHAQVRLIDDLLVNELGKPLGFADSGVVTLDPAAGTGTYLLGVIQHALDQVASQQGAGAAPGQATTLAENLYGFELMVGPYAVTELRVTNLLRDRKAVIPRDGIHVYLTDTLESPNTKPPQMPLILQSIAEQHAKALKVKSLVPVIVCLGNPPYDRHEAVDIEASGHLGKWGGWVRFDDPLPDEYAPRGASGGGAAGTRRKLGPRQILELREERSILYKDFVKPALEAKHGVHVKNLYNLYVYFWRWALWKVFEHETAAGPGIVSFISASSYLDGDAFCGMREHMRRLCDEIWVLDLGGEGRGTRKSENVFAIQTPVAIAIAMRAKKGRKDQPAKVHYARLEGTRKEKLEALEAIRNFKSVKWQECPGDWQAPFRPAGKGEYFTWPLLTDLMPWQHSGVQLKRTWPIAPDVNTLERRWRALLRAADRSLLFHETGDREVNSTYTVALTVRSDSTPIAKLPQNAPIPPVRRYGYRSFDRQWIIADGRLMSRPRPDLWYQRGKRQVFLTSLFSHPLGYGPSLTASAIIPDLDHFRGSYGAKAVIPFYRQAGAGEPNILPGLLDVLSSAYYKRKKITPEDFMAYVYGVLAQPEFTARFRDELETRELRVPITKDAVLFRKARDVGARLLWLHTYGERFVPKGKQRGHVPRGRAKCVKAVPGDADGYPESFDYNEATGTLRVGEGEFRPVARAVYEFEVSGLKVVQSWLKYRMKKGAGKKSSPLDDIRPERWTSEFTTELLELLWVLEATVEGYPEQAELLEAVMSGPCVRADELPEAPEWMRKPPSLRESEPDLFSANGEN